MKARIGFSVAPLALIVLTLISLAASDEDQRRPLVTGSLAKGDPVVAPGRPQLNYYERKAEPAGHWPCPPIGG